MFTGIIKNLATITAISPSSNGLKLQITPNLSVKGELGASIAINGICLTVTNYTNNVLSFDVSPNTIEKTTIKHLKIGDLVNIEESLKVGDEIGGHFVLGHVDSVGNVVNIDKSGENWFIDVKIPSEFMEFVSSRGSITIDGISLTTNDVVGDAIKLCIIPHTWKHTNIQNYLIGTKFNFEVDMFARNIVNFMKNKGL